MKPHACVMLSDDELDWLTIALTTLRTTGEPSGKVRQELRDLTERIELARGTLPMIAAVMDKQA